MLADLHVVAVIEGKSGSAEAIKTVAKPCIEATRKEQGCLKYDLYQDETRPDRFIFIEHWASKDILDQHGKTPHLLALVAGLADLTIRPLEVSILKQLI